MTPTEATLAEARNLLLQARVTLRVTYVLHEELPP